MKEFRLITIITVLLIAGFAAAASAAVMFKYVDENGNVVLTDNRSSIPEKSKDSIEILDENATPDGFAPEGKLADEIRRKRREGGLEGQVESAKARWYKENPDIEPSIIKRIGFYIEDLWIRIPFERAWPAIAAVIWTIIAFVISRFIISRSKRRMVLFFSILTALTFVLMMYTLVLK